LSGLTARPLVYFMASSYDFPLTRGDARLTKAGILQVKH
jgi:hypothetical protein